MAYSCVCLHKIAYFYANFMQADMKDAKLYYLLDRRSTTIDGAHPVKLVAYYKSKQSLISIGYYFTEEQWNVVQDRTTKKNKLFDSSKGSNDSDLVLTQIRKELDQCMDKAMNALLYLKKKGVSFQAVDIKNEYEKEHHSDDELMYFANCHHMYLKSRIENGASPSTISSYKATFNMLAEYYQSLSKRNKVEKLRMVQIDVNFLRDYKEYLREKKNDSEATVGLHYRYVRALFNYAINKGVWPQSAYPFGKGDDGVKIQAVRRTKKALTKKELLTLFAYRPKLLKSQLRNFDLSVLSFLLNGANMIDIALLTYGKNYSEHDNKITFMREKTYRSKQEIIPIEVPSTKEIRHLMDLYGNEYNPENYIFKIINPQSNKTEREQVNNLVRAINKTLKCVAKKCGIRGDISYQFFRHTHATLALKVPGVEAYDLMVSMGHSSIKTTQAYINSLPDEENKIGEMKSNLMVGIYDE